ncbi:response regulator transcription factor [Nocardia sp. CA-128927]|uniref:response regulator transcription factor n=1 Tax=Nocardia sp. CA-128927 TaxID=3239975 RepID=UPI003D992B22
MTINIMVADKFRLPRSALVALLEQHESIRVIGSTGIGAETVELASQYRPGVTVISAENTDLDDIAVAEEIADIPGCRTLVLGKRFTHALVRRAYRGPISGLVHKTAPPHQLFEAIHQVHRGQRVLDPEFTVAVLDSENCPLTPREVAVLEQVALGDTVSEIATKTLLSEGTVRNYLAATVAKLGARNRIDAVRIAQDAHWI